MLKANLTGLLAKLNTLPLEKIGNEVVDAISDADDLLKDARPAVKGFDGLVSNANEEQVKPLAQDASALLKEARARIELRPGEPLQSVNDTLADARKLLGTVTGSWPKIAGETIVVLRHVDASLDLADKRFVAAQKAISPSSPAYFELVSTLRQVNDAAAAIRVLAQYLQRTPGSILMGNRGQGGFAGASPLRQWSPLEVTSGPTLRAGRLARSITGVCGGSGISASCAGL
jgi:paraquat-inducible protein B